MPVTNVKISNSQNVTYAPPFVARYLYKLNIIIQTGKKAIRELKVMPTRKKTAPRIFYCLREAERFDYFNFIFLTLLHEPYTFFFPSRL